MRTDIKIVSSVRWTERIGKHAPAVGGAVVTYTTMTFSLSASSKKTNPLLSGAGSALKSNQT